MLHDFIVSQWRMYPPDVKDPTAYECPLGFAFSPRPAPPILWDDPSFAPLASLGEGVTLKDPTRPETKASYCSSLAEAFDACRCSHPYFRLFSSLDGYEDHRITRDEHEDAADFCCDDDETTNPAALQYYELPGVGTGSGAASQGASTDEEYRFPTDTSTRSASPTDATAHMSAAVETPESSTPDAHVQGPPSFYNSSALVSAEQPYLDSTGSAERLRIDPLPHSLPSPQPAAKPPPPMPLYSPLTECTSSQPRRGELSIPSPVAPSVNPDACFGPTGRRDYSPRKKTAASSQPSPSKAGERMTRDQQGRQAAGPGATSILTAKRVADEPPEKDTTRGKRQRLASVLPMRMYGLFGSSGIHAEKALSGAVLRDCRHDQTRRHRYRRRRRRRHRGLSWTRQRRLRGASPHGEGRLKASAGDGRKEAWIIRAYKSFVAITMSLILVGDAVPPRL